jgi:predicted aldo/keto reductase-like oxidoreductase
MILRAIVSTKAFDANFRSFQQQVVPEAAQRGMAILGMKPFSGTADPLKKGVVTPEEALRYAMSVPHVTVTITGKGKVRFVGFTGHKDPAIHLKMLSHNYPFDTIQMPLNCFDTTFRSFGGYLGRYDHSKNHARTVVSTETIVCT